MISISDAELRLGIQAFVQGVIPKSCSSEKIPRYVEQYFPLIQTFLQRNLSKNLANYCIHLTKAMDSSDPKDAKGAHIWIHKSSGGVQLVYIPAPTNLYPREDALVETVATELFIPVSRTNQIAERVLKVQKSRVFSYEEGRKIELSTDLRDRNALLKMPLGERFFSPLPLTHETWAKKAPGFESFKQEPRFIQSLSVGKFLDVFGGIIGGLNLLESRNLVSLDIRPENIVFKQGEEEAVMGLIDSCSNVVSVNSEIQKSRDKRRNILAQNGHASFETHHYALIITIAEVFFLEQDEGLPLDQKGCEMQALTKFQRLALEPHYRKVLELKTLHHGFGKSFSQALLDYVTKSAREGEENFQLVALEQFAFKMALFPEISALFLETMKVNKSHQQFLDSKKPYEDILKSKPMIPTLDEIKGVLEQGKINLQGLHLRKELTEITTISLDQTVEIVNSFLGPEPIDKSDPRVESLWRIINDVLIDSPYVGSEVRTHKNELWKDTDLLVPFSLWICVQKDSLRLEFFDPKNRKALATAGNKKVKAGTQVDVPIDGALLSTPIVIVRIKRGAQDWNRLAVGNKMQEKILSIPGAEQYFWGLSRKHAPHQGDHKSKLELTSLRFEATLGEILKRNESRNLSTLNYIAFLQNIGKGIELLQSLGLSHGDMKVSNIAIVKSREGVTARIFDFDFTAKFYQFFTIASYPFWNTLCQEYGFVSAETDLYGYVLIVSEVLLKGFKAQDSSESKENRILRFQRITETPDEEKVKLKKLIIDKMQKMYPGILGDVEPHLFASFGQRDIEEIPQTVFTHIKQLGVSLEAIDLQSTLTEFLIFDRVFDLLVKTFQADQSSKAKMQENLKENPDQKQSVLKALAEAGFPTLNEIRDVLAQCKEIASAAEQRILV